MLSAFLLMPESYLVIGVLLAMSVLGLLWPPLLVAAPLAALGMGAVVVQALRNAAAAEPAAAANLSRSMRLKRFLLIALLHVLQPAARLHGRLIHGLTPWRRGRWTRRWAIPSGFSRSIWSEVWREPANWLQHLERLFKAGECAVHRGGDYDNWDLEIGSGSLGVARVVLAAEDHAGGRQYVRVKVWPVMPRLPILLVSALAGLSVAAMENAPLVADIFVGAVVALVALFLFEAGAAIGTVRHVLESLEAPDFEQRAGVRTRSVA
jgi:hypothetical protein